MITPKPRTHGGVPASAASDAAGRAAMRFALEGDGRVLEPGAAVGLAAVPAGEGDVRGRRVATIVTGGDVDAAPLGPLSAA
ncbi:MAG: hypothetical protein ACLFTG_05900 [Alphaproteobacteria bacterium]